jgi:hypothetical protein
LQRTERDPGLTGDRQIRGLELDDLVQARNIEG